MERATLEKINSKDASNIKIRDILQYQLERNAIIHRVTNIEEEDGKLYFTTKGDNNEFPDTKRVEENQVMGIVKFKIPYIGYPSVWFSEFLFKRKSNIQT